MGRSRKVFKRLVILYTIDISIGQLNQITLLNNVIV